MYEMIGERRPTMNTEILLGKEVNHKTFGSGVITDINGTEIKINFSGKGMKSFRYPTGFNYIEFVGDEGLTQEVRANIEEALVNKKKEDEEKKAALLKKTEEVIEKGQIDILISGNTFQTHHDVLNECFGCNYKMYQKAYKRLSNEYAVWFPNIAKKVAGEYVSTDATLGWVNIMVDGGKEIIQMDHDTIETLPEDKVDNCKCLIFISQEDKRGYEFVGVYTPSIRVDGGYKHERLSTKFDCRTMTIL